MDTRSKKSRPFLIWSCFFIGLNLLVGLAAFGLFNLQDLYDEKHEFQVVLYGDYKESSLFKRALANRVQIITRHSGLLLFDNFQGRSLGRTQIETLRGEGDNLKYWAYNQLTKNKLSNMSEDPVLDGNKYVLPEGYDYYLYFDGKMLWAVLDGRAIDAYDYLEGYRGFLVDEFFHDTGENIAFSNVRLLLAVKEDIQPIPNEDSLLYTKYKEFLFLRWVLYGIIGLGIISLILLTIAIVKRESKHAFDEKIAKVMSHLWLEAKLFLLLAASLLIIMFFRFLSHRLSESLITGASALGVGWLFYLLGIDLYYNRGQVFAHNIPNWLIHKYRLLERGRPFKKALMMRAVTLILAECALIILAVTLTIALRNAILVALFAFAIVVALGIYLIYRYLEGYNRTLTDMESIINQIERMREGHLHTDLTLSTDSDFYGASQNLNAIQEGIARATEERLKSERMKVELITNVSHDLKTPLTSIISYVELLASEDNLSDTAKDYVAILSEKSEKLKGLIQDIFDLSKATSGAIVLEQERLDISKLIRQTLADMEEEIEKTNLSFKCRYPEIPIYIMGDGKKLYRVFQNLLTNILKYALEGSRVYIDVIHDVHDVTITLKNIANYEMNFLETEVTERFVRGDKARTTEGSGLGLAIAKGYVEAMDGSLKVKVDGDLFKVEIIFPIHWEEEAQEQS